MTIPRLATRNLLRNRRRTILTTVAIVAGTGILVLGEAFVSGVDENIVISAIEGSVGHVLARPADYPLEGSRHPIDELLTITEPARALLDSNAVAWTERTLFTPIAASGSDSLRVVAIGYDPERDPNVFSRRLWQVKGALPRPDAAEIAVGRRVARLLSLEPGDPLVLQVRTHRGAINALEVTVSAVVNAGNTTIDILGILVPQQLVRSLIAASAPSHLAVKLAHRDDAEAFQAKLAAALGAKAEVVTWREETRELLELQSVRRKSLGFIVFTLMALAAFGIANTVLMAAYERVREVGTLRAMGMTEPGVVGLFLVEGAMMGLIGGVLGGLWGGALAAYWANNPIDFSEALEKEMGSGVSISALVYTRFSPAMIAAAVILGVVVAVLASIYPARVASRMVPADAVRAD